MKDEVWQLKIAESAGCKVIPLKDGNYYVAQDVQYWSKRYKKYVTAEFGIYDGATGAVDIPSKAWIIHDQICNKPFFDDGTTITSWQAAQILFDILWEEKYYFRANRWRFSTFAFGCVAARDNGIFKRKN